MRIFILFISLISLAYAQDCKLSLSGQVIDEHDAQGLEMAVVSLEDNAFFTYTDDQGKFILKDLCPGTYHIQISHLSCESKSYFIQLKKDTSITMYLEHHDELLQTVTIHEERKSTQKTLAKVNIQGDELDKKQGGTLGDILKSIAGVNSLQTGSGISKPIIHGLFGNRIQILNNGVGIEGQQWGNEHAPEIDPFAVQKISVVKGANALKYGTRAMGGVVLLENEDMPVDNHLHGSFNLIGFTNGLKLASSLNLEGGFKENPFFKWRAQYSFSKSGDHRAADYYLSNTASQEMSGNFQFEYKTSKHTTLLNWSVYQAKIGILRGAHIGNLSDLETAFTREEPFYTEDKISFNIDKPKQEVLHNTVKISHVQFLEKGQLDLAYNFQHNHREEFDIRRTSDKASLDLNLQSQQVQVAYKHKYKSLKYEWGTQFQNKINYNDPDLNVQPLIPNYRTNLLSFYALQELHLNPFIIDFGARYEYQNTLVKYYDNNELLQPRHLFNNYAFSVGLLFQSDFGFSSRSNVNLISRSPEINELYSNGLHHGAAAIEIGDASFNQERMWSLNQTFTYVKEDKFQIELTPYYQYFYDYIQLQAQEELRLTIRGAFPVYKYEQVAASIWGFDFSMRTEVYKNLFWKVQSSVVRGKELDSHSPLSFMPADYLQNSLNYAIPLKGKHKELNLGIQLRTVSKQIREPAYDFAEAPDAYNLLGAEIGGKVKFNKVGFNWQIEATNLLNTSYRDYLNRYRYYADDLGINIAIRTKFIF